MKIACWCFLGKDFVGGDTEAKRRMDQVKEGGIDILLPFVYNNDGAWYRTELDYPNQQDHFTRVWTLAKERDLEIHPVIVPFNDVGLSETERAMRGYQSGQPGGNKCDGRFCASWIETREGGIKILQDVLSNHEVDGIHLDAVRYVDTGQSLPWPCRCEACRTRYRELFGKDTITADDLKVPGILYKFLQFRGENIRELVERAREITKEKGLPLSLAARVHYFEDALVEGQDWVQWARDGLMDFICPMNYSTSRKVHKERLSGLMALIGTSVPIYDGIGRKSSSGEISTAQMIQQAEDVLRLGVKGITVFHLNVLNQEDFRELASFKKANT